MCIAAARRRAVGDARARRPLDSSGTPAWCGYGRRCGLARQTPFEERRGGGRWCCFVEARSAPFTTPATLTAALLFAARKHDGRVGGDSWMWKSYQEMGYTLDSDQPALDDDPLLPLVCVVTCAAVPQQPFFALAGLGSFLSPYSSSSQGDG